MTFSNFPLENCLIYCGYGHKKLNNQSPVLVDQFSQNLSVLGWWGFKFFHGRGTCFFKGRCNQCYDIIIALWKLSYWLKQFLSWEILPMALLLEEICNIVWSLQGRVNLHNLLLPNHLANFNQLGAKQLGDGDWIGFKKRPTLWQGEIYRQHLKVWSNFRQC